MSAIRVNPYPLPDLIAALNQTQQQQNTATLELSTGSKINAPSDDPAGAAELIQNQAQSSQSDSFLSSASTIDGLLSTADSTLSSVVTALQRAISLGVEGANGTLSDSDRTAIAQELTGIQTQLISLANTSYQGQYIFAGTAETQPYVVDATSPSGVTYAGNAGTNSVTIGTGYQLQTNLPGSQIFNGAGADVFQSISDLINALQSNTAISSAVNEVSTAYNYLTAQRVFYGNAKNQISDQQNYLNSEKVQLGSQENTIAGANLPLVASQLNNAQIQLNAELSAIGRISQTSLFDYLK
ncbi:MAG: flagellar hook-associated protein FlgL [Terriglobales bacterium]|jgi:flagellar hook-associated protein 3 FlgL